MNALQLGVLVFAFCLTTQVVCQNSTAGNSTMNGTVTPQPTGTFSGTTPMGAGPGLQVGVGALLTPILLVLQRLC